MHFPYLRGRHSELPALRELAEKNLLGMHVVPIIEPVKITPTFMSTMEAFAEAELEIALIFNPKAADLAGQKQMTANDFRVFLEGGKVVPSIIVDTSALECLRELQIVGVNILTTRGSPSKTAPKQRLGRPQQDGSGHRRHGLFYR